MDSLRGESPNLPYRAFYVSEGITDSLELKVKDILKEVEVQPASGDDPAEKAYRWSLGWIGKVEPIAITSSLLFELPDSEATDDIEYGIIVPFSEGGDYLSSIDEETDKPIFNPRLRAVYLHKPDDVKVKLSWEPSDALQAWHTPFKARTDGDEYYANGKIASGDELVHKDDTNPIFLEAIKPGTSELKWGIGDKVHTVKVFTCDMAADANRDGTIKFAGNIDAPEPFDVTSKDEPFRFWCNFDDDGDSGGGAEDPDSTEKDSSDNEIKTQRDLEDFARLHLNIGGLHESIVAGNVTVELEWRSASGHPGIKIYRAAEKDGGDQYLKTTFGAIQQTSGSAATALGTVDRGSRFRIPTSFWQSDIVTGVSALSASHPNRYLLFEGVTEGKGELVMTFWKGDDRIGEGPRVWVDLVDIRKMYQSSQDDVFAGAPPDETEQTVVSVHGWNMSPKGSRNYAETMFKRLWHRGFKGRFAYFRWNTYWITATDVIGTLTTQYFANYNNSEYIAWTQGAPALKSFVENLPYDSKNIAAHSMGNIVVGEAMRLGMRINNYALMQPAVPAACYDDRDLLKQTSTYQHSFLGINVTMWDEASPDDDPDAATRNMSYRGMLTDIGQNGNLILFYLPNDSATSNAWELNNDLTKPSGTLSGQFRYDRNAPTGQKLYRDFGGGVREYTWASRRESSTFACRTWGKAAGAELRTQGAIGLANRVDLSAPTFALPGETEPGFGDEHSGQFTAQIQVLKPFYDELINRLQIGPANP